MYRQTNKDNFIYEASVRSFTPSERYEFRFLFILFIMYSLAIVRGRVLRSKQFVQQTGNGLIRPTHSNNNNVDNEESVPPLISVDSLMGMGNTSSNPTFVSLLGILSRNPSNLAEFFLEDQQARVPLDLSHTVR